jgi:hypothetical protein
MSLGSQIAEYRSKGFTSEQAEVIAIMRVAAGVLFRDFPDSFLLFGGATLLLFYDSVRHSADLDLFQRTDNAPTCEDLRGSLGKGLTATAEALNLSSLQIEILPNKIYVKSSVKGLLFTVDVGRFGSVLDSEVVEYTVEIDDEHLAKVKAASRDFLLLQKAECFLLRSPMKARDAFDIYRLRQLGVVLSEQLENHLDDTLSSFEIEAPSITARIEQLDEKRCRELRSLIPPPMFELLAKEQFKAMRDSVRELYQRWL